MPEAKWGGERSRPDVYGPAPTREGVLRAALEAQTAESPSTAELELHEDQLAVKAMIQFCKQGEPVITDEQIKRAISHQLFGTVLGSDEFLLGDNEETRRFGVLNKRSKDLSAPQRVPFGRSQGAVQPKRYHRA